MGLIIGIAIIIAFTVVPVMIAAKLLNADNRGFWACLIAVILASVCAGFAAQFIQSGAIAVLVTLAISALIYSLVLGAKYLQSACIALLALAIQYGSILVLGILGVSLSA